MTYPDPKVVAELEQHFVACRLESGAHPEVSRKMNVRWLPGLVVCDAEERLAHLQIGFLPPSDLLPELAFARGIVAMGAKRYDDADRLFQTVAESDAERAADAWYWRGVSRYRQTKDPASYRECWKHILERWPRSQAARKVSWMVKQA